MARRPGRIGSPRREPDGDGTHAFGLCGHRRYPTAAGYSLLLTSDPSANHLTDLARPARAAFLLDLSLIGEAVTAACASDGLRRVNYEVLGNSMDFLHGHVHARYDREPPDRVGGPVWRYPKELRYGDDHAYSDQRHGALQALITAELERIMGEAYAQLP